MNNPITKYPIIKFIEWLNECCCNDHGVVSFRDRRGRASNNKAITDDFLQKSRNEIHCNFPNNYYHKTNGFSYFNSGPGEEGNYFEDIYFGTHYLY